MTTRPRRTLATAAALVVPAVLLAAGQADSASTTVGATFTSPEVGCGADVTFVQRDSAGNRYTVPSAGVITSFSFQASATDAPASVTFKLARPMPGDSTATVVATTESVPVTSGALITRPVRIAARAGDRIGFYLPAETSCATQVAGSDYYAIGGDGAVGASLNALPEVGIELDLSAVVETDADGDGFGDTTQDRCPQSAATQAACPPGTPGAPDTLAPDTTVQASAAKAKRKPSGKPKKAALTATFAATEAASFRCSLDAAAPSPCTSPYVAKVEVGTHRLTVVATDAVGNVDATPATTSVTVKATKKKHR